MSDHEPYFTVLTDPKFLRAKLTPEARGEFFASGEALVDFLWRTIQLRLAPDFAPTAILEYGCGAGRLAIPLARRAARRAGSVTAVDRSPAMLETAREEAAAAGLSNIVFRAPADVLNGAHQFDFVVCYLVLQRMPPAQGLPLLRALLDRIVPGGVGVFQFPYRSRTASLVAGTRWLRERVPAVNAIVNAARGRHDARPFIATHTYALGDALRVFDESGFPAVHVTFDDHEAVSSALVFAERPISPARHGFKPDTAIDVQALIASTSIEQLNAAAEEYFASLTTWEHHLAKPFSSVDEAPWLLTHFAVLLQALRLKAGQTVLEFGAGTGWLSRFLTQLGCRVILLDVSPSALRIARELYSRVPIVGERPTPEFLEFDGARIGLPDASVDRIVCFHAFHHVARPERAIAEFARVLRPGGLAAFAEPGPTHSRAPQSQFEMRSYGVVENDVDVHEVWRTARTAGFADIRMMVFHGQPFEVSLADFEDFLRGGETTARLVAEARVFLRGVRTFVLIREGHEQEDSRSARGLRCEIHARLAAPAVANAPLRFAVTVTNIGAAVWLPATAGTGGVALGVRVFDRMGGLLSTAGPTTSLANPPREITSGETITFEASLPPLAAGRYAIELDCVAHGVGWFSQLGSRPARVDVEVSRAPQP